MGDAAFKWAFGSDDKTQGKPAATLAQSQSTAPSPAQAMHPLLSKMVLAKRDSPGDSLEFMYVPTEISESRAAKWKLDAAQGVRIQQMEYEHTENRVISMDLFFNDWGETRQVPVPKWFEKQGSTVSSKPGTMTERAIRWLMGCLDVAGGSSLSGTLAKVPPVLHLVWNEVFVCVLTDLKVQRQKLAPLSLEAIRASISVQLTEVDPNNLDS